MSNNLDLTVLKTLLTNKKYALEFSNEENPKLFDSNFWNFAHIVTTYVKNYKDLPTLRVLTDKLLNNTAKTEYVTKVWGQIDAVSCNDLEYKHDLEKLKKRYAEKQLLTLKDSLDKVQAGTLDLDKALEEVQKTTQSIKTLNKQKTYENLSIKEYLPSFVEKFNAKKNDPNLDRGLMTKYSFLDHCTNGLKPADFVLIAGESGFGKSLFLNNIAIQVWMQDNTVDNPIFTTGKNIIYFSLEMPYEDCFNRLLSRMSGVPSRSIENADLTREEFDRVKKCLDFISKYPHNFKIVDLINASANDLELILLEDESYDSIFIDYLGIMETNDKSDEADWLKQGRVSQEVRAIGRKFKKPLFSAVQLNRKTAGKESSESVGLNRLARSGTIATHATHVVQIENRPNEEDHSDFIYHLIKNRKGPKGKGVLLKHLACATLLDSSKPENEEINYDEYFKNQDDISDILEDLIL